MGFHQRTNHLVGSTQEPKTQPGDQPQAWSDGRGQTGNAEPSPYW